MYHCHRPPNCLPISNRQYTTTIGLQWIPISIQQCNTDIGLPTVYLHPTVNIPLQLASNVYPHTSLNVPLHSATTTNFDLEISCSSWIWTPRSNRQPQAVSSPPLSAKMKLESIGTEFWMRKSNCWTKSVSLHRKGVQLKIGFCENFNI